MTKSSVRRVTADKARSKYRKTTRKVGTGKAYSSDRKTASKAVVERARYRKSAARFEPFAYDAQMPESMRALAEKSVAQTREFYVQSFEAALASWESFVVSAGQGTVALNRRAIDLARRNINNGFGLAERLAGAKSLTEAMELQTTYWRKQVGDLASQAGEMRALTTRVSADEQRRSRRR
jgi:hypothetical protein